MDWKYDDTQPRRCLDTTRAEQLRGWRAQTSFDEGLRRTIAWYREQRVALAGREASRS